MVQAHERCRLPNVLPEFKIFYLAFGACDIVQNAELVAHDKGQLADLGRKMEKIRKREGLTEGEFWYHKQGAPDHQQLEAEADVL